MSERIYMRFKRKGVTLIRPVDAEDDLTGVHGVIVTKEGNRYCNDSNPVAYVCMDPDNEADKWAISQQYFEKNYEIDA